MQALRYEQRERVERESCEREAIEVMRVDSDADGAIDEVQQAICELLRLRVEKRP